MKWIGLTGGIACGKSTVSRKLRMRGLPVVDADEIAREVVKPQSAGLRSVVQEFGQDVLAPDGSLDRDKLARMVFTNEARRKKLESLLHPLIQAETARRKSELIQSGAPVAIYDIPLLFEIQAQDQFDFIIVVSCSLEQQKERLKKRNQLSDIEIEKRLAAQMPLSEKEKAADFVIDNSGDEAHLDQELDRLLSVPGPVSGRFAP